MAAVEEIETVEPQTGMYCIVQSGQNFARTSALSQNDAVTNGIFGELLSLYVQLKCRLIDSTC